MTAWEDFHNEAVQMREQAASLTAGAADLEQQSHAARCPVVELRTSMQCSLDVHDPDEQQHDLGPQLAWPG